MYGFRSLTENRVLMGIGLVVLVTVLGIGTYVMMYQPSGGMSIHLGSAPKSPGGDPSSPLAVTSTAGPPSSPSPAASLALTPTPAAALPVRSAVSMKVQSSGGTQSQVEDMLRRAQQLGYPAMPADVPGKAISGVVIRHKPGMSAVAMRASTELSPGAALEEHADISVDVVIAVGKS